MNALSHAMSWVFPNRRSNRYTPGAPVILVLDGSSFCISRTKNGEEKCECKSKWQGRSEV
jgi:hypothetical protein